MMKSLQNERGIALITSLLLTLISLAIVLAVLYLITQGIQVSGSSKRYTNAREASFATVDMEKCYCTGLCSLSFTFYYCTQQYH